MTNEEENPRHRYKVDIEKQISSIELNFGQFLEGTRVILLMCRQKDGGHNKEYQRRYLAQVTHNKEQALRAIEKCLVLKNEGLDPLRIYMTVNSRDLKKAERNLKSMILEMDFNSPENRKIFYERLERNWHSALMKESARETPYFLIDVDDEGDKDLCGDALMELARLEVEVVHQYRTKNGWHIITQPFNPELYKAVGDIKKDGQLLLCY